MAQAAAVSGRDYGWKDRRQRDGLFKGWFGQRLARALRRNHGAKHVHRVGPRVGRDKRAARGLVQGTGCRHLAAKRLELRLVGKLTVPQEVRDLLIRDRGGEVLDQIAASIDEPAIGAIDLADRGLRGADSFQPWAEP